MIEGRKDSGNLVTADGEGRRIERTTRQCCHCQYTWIYDPHDEARARNVRGFCLRCYGFTCERPECHREQAMMLRDLPGRPCIAFEEHYRRRLQKIANDPCWDVTPSGIIVAHYEGIALPS